MPLLPLQTIYCGDTFSRSHLELPQPLGVDFRASCFCHRVSDTLLSLQDDIAALANGA